MFFLPAFASYVIENQQGARPTHHAHVSPRLRLEHIKSRAIGHP